jgi:hypothetical protein
LAPYATAGSLDVYCNATLAAGLSKADCLPRIPTQQAGALMPPSPKPDPIQQRLAAIEQQLQTLQRSQHQATLTITRQLEAFIQLHSLIGPIPGLLHSWPVSADFALHMLRLLLAQPPELVIEFGSGTSTALLLQALALANPHCTGSAQGAPVPPKCSRLSTWPTTTSSPLS